MKAQPYITKYLRWFGILAGILSLVLPARADPIELPEKSITPEISFIIGFAILLEVTCIWLILRRARKPRFFILWLIGMHLFTYPAFMGMLWLLQNIRPAFAVGIGEGLIVIIEGCLIFLICRFVASAKPEFTAPSIAKCLVASFIGNAVSAGAFPILLAVYDHFVPI